MTLEQFKNLKIDDEIKFGNGNIGKIIGYDYKEQNVHSKICGYNISVNDKIVHFVFNDISNYITFIQDGELNVCCPFESFKLSFGLKSEKEQIEQQIKQLQDKLKEIEKNEVEKIAKTLIDGDFVEIVWHDGRSVFHKVFGITETQIGQYFDFNSDTKLDWYIPFNSISKLIIRKDIKEAHEKLISLLKPTR